jgi:NAD(P)-dependent dehydrogenase (short-subunit alcohol dehydrogenase family)
MVVFLTGGNGNIGKVIKDKLVKQGIEVIAPSSNDFDLIKTMPQYLPNLDGFIHCAGIHEVTSHLEAKNFNQILKVNAVSFVELCSSLTFSKGSNIIAIGSLYATETREGRIQYAMSKHALLAAVKTIALEKAFQNIKVNMVSPGFVDNAMTRKNNTQERIKHLQKATPLGLVDAQQIAELCLYLLTKNTAITGQNIIVDGGYSLVGV